MAKSTAKKSVKTGSGNEFDAFLKRYPKTAEVDVFVHDMNGFLRGKRFPVAEARKIWESGVEMPQPEGATLAVLKAQVPEFGAARNPCDVTAQAMNDQGPLRACALDRPAAVVRHDH